MSGFAIFNIEVKKPEEYKEYVEKVRPIAEKFGGEYIVRGGETKVLEGTWAYPRTCCIFNVNLCRFYKAWRFRKYMGILKFSFYK